jgi:hypothetical protein
MPKIILKDGSEFIVDQAILEENILPAQPDEMIQLGKNYFKKSSIEIIHSRDRAHEDVIEKIHTDKNDVHTHQKKHLAPKYEISAQNKKTGKLLIITPIMSLIVIFILFIAINSILGIVYESGGENIESTSLIVEWVLGFLGIISFASIIPMAILGFALRSKKTLSPGGEYDKRSGHKKGEVPNEIQNWNWGAAAFTVYWGAYNVSWKILLLTPLLIIPFINIIIAMIFGYNGNKWAWRSNRWPSVDIFKKTQDKYNLWAILVFILFFVYAVMWSL